MATKWFSMDCKNCVWWLLRHSDKITLAEQRVKWHSVLISSIHWKRTTLFRSVYILYCQWETGVYTKTSTLLFSHNWNIQSVCTAQLMNMTVLNAGNWPFKRLCFDILNFNFWYWQSTLYNLLNKINITIIFILKCSPDFSIWNLPHKYTALHLMSS